MKNKLINLFVVLMLMSAGVKSQTFSYYPTSVVQFNQGRTNLNRAVQAVRSIPDKAKGVPQDVDVETGILNFVSLGYGGSIVLSLSGPLDVTPETVVAIYETTYGFTCSNYPEKADVYLSADGIDYVLLGRTCVNDNTIMYPSGKISQFQYIKVVDVTNRADFTTKPESDAYDLDGIEISKIGPMPVELANMTLNYYQGLLRFKFSTYSEQNTKSFTLQNLLNDRMSWTNIMEFEAAGESQTVRHYQQIVNFAATGPVSYFRLKETELDDRVTYHRMIALQTTMVGGSFRVCYDILGRPVANPCPFAIYINR
jgi:hypothetical protein